MACGTSLELTKAARPGESGSDEALDIDTIQRAHVALSGILCLEWIGQGA